MKSTLRRLAAALIVCAAAAQPAQADSFTTPDKAAHLAGSAMLGAVATIITDNDQAAFALALAPGFAKEVYDSRRGGTGFSWRDLAADALGAYIGVKFGGLIIRPNFIGYQWKGNL
jgi:putative lipoprotein